ncbi:tripartite tricarboxylate transporter substrate binding protein [Ramlibacter sp. G-1-2-2]|uniref:Tripartite tricarboxylate transporter substrate binding protein n=1 Tax=Ramlibacter agri TaxID=2728837 RepID=A0A848H5P6_9BURK|nr:tripartite tricarboxylate transporter substrate binding protein [Ramlibacter agri]NML45827.1 tripartite tricarboxylate transporter substrate binding protein [Ramlibacter agri]
MHTRRGALQGLAAGAAALVAGRAFAEDGVLTVFVGAASSMDFTARLIAEQYRVTLGRPALMVSKLGAGQRLALGEVKRAAPDGRNLVFATSGPFSVYPYIYNKLDYDPVADFTPIAGISFFDVAIATGPMTGVKDLKELIEWQRRQKEPVFGSAPGNGSLSHFVGISTNLATGLHMTHVAYKDSGVGIIDLASGRLPMMITGLQPMVEMHKAGRIKLLAVSGSVRSPLVPEVPTLREAGVDVSSSTYTGVFGPPKMAPELVAKLHDAVAPMLSNPVILEKFAQQGMTPWPATPQQLAALLADERKRFEALVKASGMPREDA